MKDYEVPFGQVQIGAEFLSRYRLDLYRKQTTKTAYLIKYDEKGRIRHFGAQEIVILLAGGYVGI